MTVVYIIFVILKTLSCHCRIFFFNRISKPENPTEQTYENFQW